MEKDIKKQIEEIRMQARDLSATGLLQTVSALFPGKTTFSTSFGWEDQVIHYMIVQQQLGIAVFTLDTGRLFKETYSVWSRMLEKYNTSIAVYYPDQEKLQDFVGKKGPNSFYESVELRKTCCGIRKVEPLSRALQDKKVWITGIRAEQSDNRQGMDWIEWDEGRQLIKIHPLFHWSLDQVKEYIRTHDIPYNALHDRGYPSIGCAPCTRAVQHDEDFRAGRWWWEDKSKKECGLHAQT